MTWPDVAAIALIGVFPTILIVATLIFPRPKQAKVDYRLCEMCGRVVADAADKGDVRTGEGSP